MEDKDNILGVILLAPVPCQGMNVSIEDSVRGPMVEALKSQNVENFRQILSTVCYSIIPLKIYSDFNNNLLVV